MEEINSHMEDTYLVLCIRQTFWGISMEIKGGREGYLVLNYVIKH